MKLESLRPGNTKDLSRLTHRVCSAELRGVVDYKLLGWVRAFSEFVQARIIDGGSVKF